MKPVLQGGPPRRRTEKDPEEKLSGRTIEKRFKQNPNKKISVAAAAGALLPESVGETETKPPGSDSVATAGLLPWLTKAVPTTHGAPPEFHRNPRIKETNRAVLKIHLQKFC